MSWASHNPELYDEICKRGIINCLSNKLETVGWHSWDTENIPDIVEILYDDSKLASALVNWAMDEINKSEREYWADRIDEAKMRKDDANL